MLTLTRIKLTNWKNFKQLELKLTNRIFVLGANASGKSNLLDAFRFLRDISIIGLQNAIINRGGWTKVRNINVRKNKDIEIETTLNDGKDNWKYLIRFTHEGGGIIENRVKILKEIVIHNDEEILSRTADMDKNKEDEETLRFSHLEQPAQNRRFREVYDYFKEIQYLHVVPQLLKDVESYPLTAGKEDFYGRNLIERMGKTNQKTRDFRLRKIQEVLRIAVPNFEELQFVKDEKDGKPHLQAIYKQWRQYGNKQREDQFSDGTLRLIGFLWAIQDGKGLLLLEEPELYLHTEIVSKLAEFIAKAQKRDGGVRQVFLSTHSYDLVDTNTIGADEVVVLKIDKETTKGSLACDIKSLKQKLNAGMTPAKAVIGYVAPSDTEQLSMLTWR